MFFFVRRSNGDLAFRTKDEYQVDVVQQESYQTVSPDNLFVSVAPKGRDAESKSTKDFYWLHRFFDYYRRVNSKRARMSGCVARFSGTWMAHLWIRKNTTGSRGATPWRRRVSRSRAIGS